MKCEKCGTENIHQWNSREYVCLLCHYSSDLDEIMSLKDFRRWKNESVR